MRYFVSMIGVLALISTAAVAGVNSPHQHGLQNQNQGQAQGQLQLQGQKQGQAQGQQQKSVNVNRNYSNSSSRSFAGAAAGAANVGNASANTTNVDASTHVDAQPAYAPSVGLTSSNCIGSAGAGIGAAGVVSLGFGTTYSVDDCLKNEYAKTLIAMGHQDLALKLLMSTEFVKQALAAPIAMASPPSSSAPTKVTPAPAAAPAGSYSINNPGPYDHGCFINRNLAIKMGQSCP